MLLMLFSAWQALMYILNEHSMLRSSRQPMHIARKAPNV
jgi:hypothetical protein